MGSTSLNPRKNASVCSFTPRLNRHSVINLHVTYAMSVYITYFNLFQQYNVTVCLIQYFRYFRSINNISDTGKLTKNWILMFRLRIL